MWAQSLRPLRARAHRPPCYVDVLASRPLERPSSHRLPWAWPSEEVPCERKGDCVESRCAQDAQYEQEACGIARQF